VRSRFVQSILASSAIARNVLKLREMELYRALHCRPCASFSTGWWSRGHVASSPAANVKQIRVKGRTPKSLSKQDVYLLQRTAAARRQLAEAQAMSDGETEILTAGALPGGFLQPFHVAQRR